MRPLLRVSTIALFVAPAISFASGIDINGFATFGVGIASIDEDSGHDSSLLRGYEEDATFKQESVLGLQVAAPVSEKFSATAQIVARGAENFTPDMAWAYMSYSANDNLTLRAGRFRTPYYLYSDYLEVGYAYHWISPPAEVYALPFDSIDGADLMWQIPMGNFDSSLQFYMGSLDNTFTQVGNDIDVEMRNQAGLAFTLNYDWLTLRASHHVAEISFTNFSDVSFGENSIGDFQALLLAADTQGVAGAKAAYNDLFVDKTSFSFSQIGLKADWNNILFVTEYATFSSDEGPVATQHRWFSTLGYTFGDFMIHATYAEADDDKKDIASGISADETFLIPDSTEASGYATIPGSVLIGGSDAIATALMSDGSTTTIGLRYDVDSGAAIKFEWSEITDELGPDGTLIRVAIDLVF